MANINIWVDQMRDAGKSPGDVSKAIKALESSGLEVKVCYKTPETLEWLAQTSAVGQKLLFYRWSMPVMLLAGLICSLGIIAISWLILK